MNVENVHSSGHSPVFQIATHILRYIRTLNIIVDVISVNSDGSTSERHDMKRSVATTKFRLFSLRNANVSKQDETTLTKWG